MTTVITAHYHTESCRKYGVTGINIDCAIVVFNGKCTASQSQTGERIRRAAGTLFRAPRWNVVSSLILSVNGLLRSLLILGSLNAERESLGSRIIVDVKQKPLGYFTNLRRFGIANSVDVK